MATTKSNKKNTQATKLPKYLDQYKKLNTSSAQLHGCIAFRGGESFYFKDLNYAKVHLNVANHRIDEAITFDLLCAMDRDELERRHLVLFGNKPHKSLDTMQISQYLFCKYRAGAKDRVTQQIDVTCQVNPITGKEEIIKKKVRKTSSKKSSQLFVLTIPSLDSCQMQVKGATKPANRQAKLCLKILSEKFGSDPFSMEDAQIELDKQFEILNASPKQTGFEVFRFYRKGFAELKYLGTQASN